MARKLVAVANVAGADARYFSTKNTGDACPIPLNAVTHTGGSDGDYVLIEDCSGENYYKDHHCGVAATDGSWVVTFWNNDDKDHEFYWTDGVHYSTKNPVPASKNWDQVALVIAKEPNGTLVVYCTEWT